MTTPEWAALLLGAPALLPLANTLLNRLTWTRGRPEGGSGPRISILVPARDEALTIEACVRAAAAAADALPGQVEEIRVLDDGSTDETPQILKRLQEELPLLRVMGGRPLPAGWVGKVHACHQLAAEARGDLLVFIDADVRLQPDALLRLRQLSRNAQLVTAVPRQEMGSEVERLLLPLLHLTYTSWLPLVLVHWTGQRRFLAANGQFIAIGKADLARIGGFAAIRGEVVDDMALCRRAKVAGLRVLFADGDALAHCRMYQNGEQVWAGFSKNMYLGIGGHPLALAFVLALHLTCFVLPYVALPILLLLSAFGNFLPIFPVSADLGLPLAASAVGVAANLLTRLVLALRHGHGLTSVLLHPVAVCLMMAILLNSYRWSRRGAIRWRGRTYAAGGEVAA